MKPQKIKPLKTAFDAFVVKTLLDPRRHRMLCCFIETKPIQEVFPNDPRPGRLVRVVATGIENVAPGLDFKLFTKQAAAVGPWEMVAVALANTDTGSPPSDEQCVGWLEDMEAKIASGDSAKFVFFDSEGRAQVAETGKRNVLPQDANLH